MQGIAGPYWYAGAAVVQILCFGIIAVYIKVRNTLLFTKHIYTIIVHCTYYIYSKQLMSRITFAGSPVCSRTVTSCLCFALHYAGNQFPQCNCSSEFYIATA